MTPDGPGTIVITWDAPGTARVQTAGDGADWLAEHAPGLLGCHDDVSGFEPAGQPVRELWRRHRRQRIARTGTLWHDLAWLIVQQRISRNDAALQWSRFVHTFGTPVPDGLVCPPQPDVVARLRYHELHRLGIERQRADALIHAARAVPALAPLVEDAAAHAMPALRAVRGLGPWTASCLAGFTWGDADAVVLGDDGIPSLVGWVLAREQRADDARMHELLEPYRPHRYRVIRLILLSGLRPPRRAPHGRRHDISRH